MKALTRGWRANLAKRDFGRRLRVVGRRAAAIVTSTRVARPSPALLGRGSVARDKCAEGCGLSQFTRRPIPGADGPPDCCRAPRRKRMSWRRREAIRRTLERRPELLGGETATVEPVDGKGAGTVRQAFGIPAQSK